MIKGLMLASYGFFGGDIGNILSQWQAVGIFDYAIPFLLIFATVYGLLTRIKIFTQADSEKKPNNVINSIIALAIALMALQFDFVPRFFAELFPRFGVALSIILIILILGGLFWPAKSTGFNWVIIAVVFIIIAVVIYNSLDVFNWTMGSWWKYNMGNIIGVVVFLGVIIAVIAGASPKDPNKNKPDNMLMKLLGE